MKGDCEAAVKRLDGAGKTDGTAIMVGSDLLDSRMPLDAEGQGRHGGW